MRTLTLTAALAALLAAAAPAGSAGNPWAALRRPLQLKPLAPGAVCPVTKQHGLDRGHLTGVGTGPVYPSPSFFSAYDRVPGWLGSKTIWTWPTALIAKQTRVLVRGIRLDAAGPMRFQLGPQWDGSRLTELHLDTTHVVGSFSNSRWGTTVTMLLVKTPGCYGLQLDTAKGTSTIVVEAKG